MNYSPELNGWDMAHLTEKEIIWLITEYYTKIYCRDFKRLLGEKKSPMNEHVNCAVQKTTCWWKSPLQLPLRMNHVLTVSGSLRNHSVHHNQSQTRDRWRHWRRSSLWRTLAAGCHGGTAIQLKEKRRCWSPQRMAGHAAVCKWLPHEAKSVFLKAKD